MIGSDTLIYRMLFNLTENSIRYNRPNGTVRIMITNEKKSVSYSGRRYRLRHTGEIQRKHFSALFPGG